MGDQLQIEFGIFMARYPGAGPTATATCATSCRCPKGCTLNGPPYNNACYTQANYYSDSFRYVVGKGTLTPYNEDCTMSVPPEHGEQFPQSVRLLGRTGRSPRPSPRAPSQTAWAPTKPAGRAAPRRMPYMRQRHDLYYSQMAPSILGENAENFVQGRRLFHIDYTTGKHIEVNNDLPAEESRRTPASPGRSYNQVTCEGCHSHNNRGVPPAAGAPFDSVVRQAGRHGQGRERRARCRSELRASAAGQGHQRAPPRARRASRTTTVNGSSATARAYTLTQADDHVLRS